MRKSIFFRLHSVLLILLVGAIASSTAFGNATITILNNQDAPGVGFNDNTPAAPVGGNSGTTVGQQRLNAFTFAANIWGATLNSSQTIVIRARWAAQSCSSGSGVLASSGSVGQAKDFVNAPFADTWYSMALANALSNSDINGDTAEIAATFNLNVGTAGCLTNSPWYYGFDNNHGAGIDLVSVLLHEFGHGLGFQTFTNSNTNFAPFLGSFTIYDRFLRDNSTGKHWTEMTTSERVASAVNTGNLVWEGPQVVANVPNVLGTPRLRINSPGAIAGNYTIGTAVFGAPLSSPGITASVVRAFDPADGNGPSPTDGCSPITGGTISGNIAFIDRGTCNFTVKVKNAQDAGAIGVIIGNVPSSANPTIPPGMTGADPTITIPTVSLALADADAIRAQLDNGVNGSMFLDHTVFSGADSSNRALMYAPNPLESGSSVSHFDTSMFPNQLMEPDNSADLTHSVTTPRDLTFSLFRDIGWTGVGSTPSPSIQFDSPTVNAAESIGSMNVIVTRTGDTSGVSSVDYATSDTSGKNACSVVSGTASAHCDYVQTLGTLQFAAGETQKVIQVPLVNDSFTEGSETFTMTLSNPSGATLGTSTATLTILDIIRPPVPNPIDVENVFVRQHYIDFLNREPDQDGFNFWVGQLLSCGSDPQCIELKRINVSGAFFLSIEFQETGYLVYRVYKSAFGNLTNPPLAPVPIVLSDFLRDTQRIGQGVQVNVGNWQAILEANKQAYMLAFVQRPDFISAFPNGMSPTDFVTQLSNRAGGPGVISPAEQANLINIFAGSTADVNKRAQVLRAVAEDQTLKDVEFNKAFVLMQYFGYLRRNPNEGQDTNFDGYNFWLAKLNQFNGNFVTAEMVKSFLLSGEYRQRFGP